MLIIHGAGKTQPTLAEDTWVRIRPQEAFYQHREPGVFRFLPSRHFQRFVNLRQ